MVARTHRKMDCISKRRLKHIAGILLVVAVCQYMGLFTHLFEEAYAEKFTYPLEVDMNEILQDIQAGKRPAVQPINEYNYGYKLRNWAKCKDDVGKDKDVVLLYVVKSALNHKERRLVIRNTWGWEERFSDVVIRRVFVLGTSDTDLLVQDDIDEEYKKYHDIVQASFVDSYYNNTIKTMVAFNWVVENCPKAQFVMFVDDDMYVSTKNLLKFARSPITLGPVLRKLRSVGGKNSERDSSVCCKWNSLVSSASRRKPKSYDDLKTFDGRLFAGYVFPSSSPMRHKPSKWYVSLQEYPYSKYPPYVTAGAFVTTFSAVADMHHASRYTKHFRFDDVFLGILAKKVGITPIHSGNFYFWKKAYDANDYADVIASHGYGDPRELNRVWEEQRSLGNA